MAMGAKANGAAKEATRDLPVFCARCIALLLRFPAVSGGTHSWPGASVSARPGRSSGRFKAKSAVIYRMADPAAKSTEEFYRTTPRTIARTSV